MNYPDENSVKKGLFKKRVLITGGLGMLGSTVAHLATRYNARVTIVDNKMQPYGANLFNLKGIRRKVKLHIADIRDKEAIKRLIIDKNIIFNFAAQVSHNDSINDPFLDADINYFGHLNVLENVRRFNPHAKILFSGSRLQFGRIKYLPVDEKHESAPRTPYALNKTAAENMYNFYFNVHGIRCVNFRISNPYGMRCQMRHSKYSIPNYFLRMAMEGREIRIFGGGNQVRDYIYVEDLAEAFILAALNEKADGETFNVGSGVGIRFKDMVNTIIETVGGGKARHIPWPDDYINVETGDYVTDISKISRILRWRPTTGFRDGIEKTYRYYLKNAHFYYDPQESGR